MYSRETLLKNSTFRHFDELCRIPHVSGYEKALSDHLLAWARGLGLSAEQDEAHNLYIQKPASAGCEGAPAVMLQAHIDMVGAQAQGADFDFQRDAIQWIIEGDSMTTGGKTTLGADDGIGAALAMTILEDEAHAYPAIEVAFTTMEEVDFSGAISFHFPFKAGYLINLDGSYANQLLCASSGGMTAEIRLALMRTATPAGHRCVRVIISGLAGGHSGREINRGRGNAIEILGRFLLGLKKEFSFMVADLKGGDSTSSLARAAQADLALAPGDIPALKAAADAMQKTLLKEHPVTGSAIKVTVIECEPAGRAVQAETVLNLLCLPPDGIVSMNEMFPHIVASSVNMGLAGMEQEQFVLKFDIRSLSEQMGQAVFEKLALAAQLNGASCEAITPYPSWDLRPQSRLRDTAAKVYRELFSEDAEVCSIHVGLEVGYFFSKKPDLDAIAYGPDRWNNHSPQEGLSIPSVYKAQDYLQALLSALR